VSILIFQHCSIIFLQKKTLLDYWVRFVRKVHLPNSWSNPVKCYPLTNFGNAKLWLRWLMEILEPTILLVSLNFQHRSSDRANRCLKFCTFLSELARTCFVDLMFWLDAFEISIIAVKSLVTDFVYLTILLDSKKGMASSGWSPMQRKGPDALTGTELNAAVYRYLQESGLTTRVQCSRILVGYCLYLFVSSFLGTGHCVVRDLHIGQN